MKAARVLFLPTGKVVLVSLACIGTVASVRLTTGLPWYSVDYWWEGSLRTAEVLADELTPAILVEGKWSCTA